MRIHGEPPFFCDEASLFVTRLSMQCMRTIRDDLKSAETDDVLDRPIMGAVLTLRALLEAYPRTMAFPTCNPREMTSWRDRYLSWLDAHLPKMRVKATVKKQMREEAAKEWQRVIDHCTSCVELGDD